MTFSHFYDLQGMQSQGDSTEVRHAGGSEIKVFKGGGMMNRGLGFLEHNQYVFFCPFSYFADSVAASNSSYCLSEGFSEKLKLDYDQKCTEEEN